MKTFFRRFPSPSSFLRVSTVLLVWLTLAIKGIAGQYDAWQHNMKVTFNYGEWERLNNFPALIILNTSIPGFSYSQFAANGQDLRFEDANGVALAYEIEKWDPNGSSYIWVRIPELVGDATTAYRPGQWLHNWSYAGDPRFYGEQYAGVHYIEALEPRNGDVIQRVFKSGNDLNQDSGMPRPAVSNLALYDPRPASQGGEEWRYPIWATYTDGMLIGRSLDTDVPVYARIVNGYLFAVRGSYNGPLFWADWLRGNSTFPQGKVPSSVEPESLRFQNFDPRNPSFDSVSLYYYNLDINWPGHNPKPKTWIRAYWGNPTAAVHPDSVNGQTWSGGNWGGVMHMNDATAKASRPIGLNPAVNGLQTTAGKVAGGLNFDGARSSTANYGTVNWFNSSAVPNHFSHTVEAWVKRSSNGPGGPDVSYGTNSDGGSFSLGVNSSGNYRSVHHIPQDHVFSHGSTLGQWQHVAIVTRAFANFDRTPTEYAIHEKLYINGEYVRGKSAGANKALNLTNNGSLVFGREAWGSVFSGNVDLDEVRFSKVDRSYNWVKCTYQTMANNNTFTTYGPISNGVPPQATWTAYNDTAWESGQVEDKITKIGPVAGQPASGNLIDHTTGNALTAELDFSSTGTTPALAGIVTTALPASGSDAHSIFTNRVDLQSRAFWSGGSVTMTVSGLSATKRYSVAIYGSRGVSAYTTRWTDVKISDNSSFANNSSAGSTLFSTSVANDTTRIITGDNAAGRVFRFDNIDPGADGDVVFTFTGNGTEAAYINGVRISTYPDGGEPLDPNIDTDRDGMSDAAEAKFGANPNDSNSRVETITRIRSNGKRALKFDSVVGNTYRLQYCDLLGPTKETTVWNFATLESGGTSFVAVTNIELGKQKTELTDDTPAASLPMSRIYRVLAP